MSTIISVLALGFFLGMRHATDADHVVAVTTILSRERSVRKAAEIGAFWGIGHTLTLLIAGGAIILFGLIVPPKLGESLEFSVAIMLILLGVWNFRTIGQIRNTNAAESTEGKANDEAKRGHRHEISVLKSGSVIQYIRPLIVGVVHGLAGSAAVALLVLPLVRNPILAAGYLLIFGIGTIAGMVLITASLAFPISGIHSVRNSRYLSIAASTLSIVFGLLLVYQIGFAGGLFLP